MDVTGDKNLGLLFRGDFDSGILAIFTGPGDVEFEGQLYRGVGQIVQIGQASSDNEGGKTGLTISLPGAEVEILFYCENEEFQRRRVTIYLGTFDDNGQLIEAEVFFDGLADDLKSNDDPKRPIVTLACEQRAFDLNRARPFKYLPEDQRRRFSGDTFFDQVAALQNREDTWGRA